MTTVVEDLSVVNVGGRRWTVMQLLSLGIRPELVLLIALLSDVQAEARRRLQVVR
jgi:hypothetical protein